MSLLSCPCTRTNFLIARFLPENRIHSAATRRCCRLTVATRRLSDSHNSHTHTHTSPDRHSCRELLHSVSLSCVVVMRHLIHVRKERVKQNEGEELTSSYAGTQSCSRQCLNSQAGRPAERTNYQKLKAGTLCYLQHTLTLTDSLSFLIIIRGRRTHAIVDCAASAAAG